MMRGAEIFLVGGCLAVAGCATSHRVQVRAVGESRVKSAAAGGLLGEARGQLALGNVGLALESFRTLQRQQPEGSEAYEGIADCYEAMGRHDLARTNYEFALAYAPKNPRLLRELAVSLDQLGEKEQAAEVRAEAVRLDREAPARTALQQTATTPMSVPRAGSITVKLPKAHLAPAQRVARLVPAAPTTAAPSSMAVAEPPPRRALMASKPASLVHTAPVPVSGAATETITRADVLPLALRAAAATSRSQGVIAQEQLAVARRARNDSVPVREGPRLERASRGEVLLITNPAAVQVAELNRGPVRVVVPPKAEATEESRARAVHPPPSLAATQVQWLPLKNAEPGSIELLNAARYRGLAARTRNALADRGWRRVAIGDARHIRAHSLVIYGPARVRLARALAAQLHCGALKVRSMESVVVLLGRDSVRHGSSTARA